MGETLSDYLFTVIGVIIFTSAISVLVVFLGVLSKSNRIQLESQSSKASITMDTTQGYAEDVIYVSGSEVFTNILSIEESIPVYLDGAQIDVAYLKNVRESVASYLTDLKTKIDLNGDYLIQYTYNSDNEIETVNYKHR